MIRTMIFFTLTSLTGAPPIKDNNLMLPIKDALESELGKEMIHDDVKLYFSDQKTPAVVKSLGVFRTNRRTNAFRKKQETACQRVFIDALMQLQARAEREGGNAVINIRGNTKNRRTKSTTEFNCLCGKMVANVALIGEVVVLE